VFFADISFKEKFHSHHQAKQKKRKRCGECIGCAKKDNCGECAPCRNDKSHQICKQRRCEKLTEKKVSAIALKVDDVIRENFANMCKFARECGRSEAKKERERATGKKGKKNFKVSRTPFTSKQNCMRRTDKRTTHYLT
jgi:hypothetical protein